MKTHAFFISHLRPLLLWTTLSYFLFFGGTNFALSTEGPFSYCSNGTCRIITTQFFYDVRGMPLDLHFACRNSQHYALTFDDGPTGNYPRILEILRQEGIKATFFVMGSTLGTEEAQQWLRQAQQEGHFIANHTFGHPDLTTLSDAVIAEEVHKNKNRILQVLGDDPVLQNSLNYLRPPFGNIDVRVQKVLQEQNFISVRWNGDRYDWNLSPNDSAVVLQRVQQQLDFIQEQKQLGRQFNTSILDLNHDGSIVTVQVLPEIIAKIKARGYQFVTLDACLK